ncbi:MAG TPA: hypothetical protein VLE99_00810 [Candidatus Saccharimonadales bacterium]|nr:hypothetical protein [Candidatus Saccharimonadales bacterium]
MFNTELLDPNAYLNHEVRTPRFTKFLASVALLKMLAPWGVAIGAAETAERTHAAHATRPAAVAIANMPTAFTDMQTSGEQSVPRPNDPGVRVYDDLQNQEDVPKETESRPQFDDVRHDYSQHPDNQSGSVPPTPNGQSPYAGTIRVTVPAAHA